MVNGLLSPLHIAIVLAVVIMLFGTKRLPELGRSLGSGLRDFKTSLDGHEPGRGDEQPRD
jgi:sec-independent protein translocase protein TatA